MTDKTLIPASPSEDDYVRQVAAAEPLPLLSETDPLALFNGWLGEALAKEPNDANAMSLATVDPDGLPDVRMVLLKEADPRGFVFYSNVESAKGRELAANPKAALLFHWKSLRRQVRVRGAVEPVSAAEADAYWADSYEVDGDKYVAIITDPRPDEPLRRKHVDIGTKIVVPNHKLKYDQSNPTGHGIIFLSRGDYVYCYVAPGGV